MYADLVETVGYELIMVHPYLLGIFKGARGSDQGGVQTYEGLKLKKQCPPLQYHCYAETLKKLCPALDCTDS